MTADEIESIHALHEQGFSLRDIATELDLDKNAVHRVVKKKADISADTAPKPAPDKTPATTLERELELRKKELDLRERELALRERDGSKTLAGVAKNRDESPKRDTERDEKRKTMLVDKHNAIIEELLDNTQDATWEVKEVDQLADRAEYLRQQIRDFCDRHDLDEETLRIWSGSRKFTAYLESMKAECDHRNRINWDNDSEEDAEIQSWMVDSFDDLAGEKTESDLVADVNAIIRHFQENCQADWGKTELNEFIQQIKDANEEVTDFCTENGVDTAGLLAITRLDELLAVLNAARLRSRKKTLVEFDYSDEQQEDLDDWMIVNLTDEADEDEEDDEPETRKRSRGLSGTEYEAEGITTGEAIMGLGALLGVATLLKR